MLNREAGWLACVFVVQASFKVLPACCYKENAVLQHGKGESILPFLFIFCVFFCFFSFLF